MNNNQKIYGPEKFEQAINSLTEKSHPDTYYEFFRKALTVCNYLQAIKDRVDQFDFSDEFLNSLPLFKGDLDVEKFVTELYNYSKLDHTKDLLQGFMDSYYSLCDFMDNLDEAQFTFKEFSYINLKYKDVLRLICDLYIYLKNYKQ